MKQRDFPSEEEQYLVRKYVMNRPLYRPDITFFKAAIIVGLGIMGILLLAFTGYFVFSLLGFFFNKAIYFSVFFLASFMIFSRFLAILAVRLYQHYASEDTRRRCLLKPTCSEYAVIVLKKYGFFIGCIKIWIRLNYKCRGNVYYIDEP